MSEPRTEEQKLRRKYLTDCKAKGIKPMPIDDWKAKFTNKTSKPSCKSVKSANPITENGRKVIVERSDVVTFKGCKPHEIMRLAMFMLIDVYKDICASNSRHNHNS